MTTPQPAIPCLESGDRLTRAEFERRYNAMPDGFKAELIEGVVSVASPVRFATHSEPHSRIITLLGVYAAATPGVRVGNNATVRLDWENELQPDGLLRLESGTSTIDADGYVCGPPEFVAEIAGSSAAQDMHAKLRVYRRAGVQEYLVWLVFEERIHCLVHTRRRRVPSDTRRPRPYHAQPHLSRSLVRPARASARRYGNRTCGAAAGDRRCRPRRFCHPPAIR